MTLEITEQNFHSIISSKQIVVVDFWAPWCGPCKMLMPVIEKLSKELETYSNLTICKCNVDECPEIAKQFSIQSIPTIIVFKDGKAIDTIQGFKPAPALKEFIVKHV